MEVRQYEIQYVSKWGTNRHRCFQVPPYDLEEQKQAIELLEGGKIVQVLDTTDSWIQASLLDFIDVIVDKNGALFFNDLYRTIRSRTVGKSGEMLPPVGQEK